MKTLAEIAVAAFHEGSDKFGETVTGVCEDLTYSTSCNYYSKVVQLVQKDGHHCTSGIGFYVDDNKRTMHVCSGHIVFRGIEITPELQAELDKAYVSQY